MFIAFYVYRHRMRVAQPSSQRGVLSEQNLIDRRDSTYIGTKARDLLAKLAGLRPLGFIAPDRDSAQAEDEEAARTQGPTFETKDGLNVKQRR
jgi:hypothetical protein